MVTTETRYHYATHTLMYLNVLTSTGKPMYYGHTYQRLIAFCDDKNLTSRLLRYFTNVHWVPPTRGPSYRFLLYQTRWQQCLILRLQRTPAYNEQFLPPANKVCEDYVFTGVCLSRGEGVIWADHPPPGQTPPYPVHAGIYPLGYGQQAGGTHPTWMHSCSASFHSLYAGLIVTTGG